MLSRLAFAVVLLLASSSHAAETKDQKIIRMLDHGPGIAKLPEIDRKRALCLALAVYQEASGQSEAAMRGVGHVVLNRTRDDNFPDTVCAVIWQVRPKRQFSWTGRPVKALVPQDQDEWVRAQHVALRVLGGDKDPTNGATYFHSSSLKTRWSGTRKPIDDIVFIVKPKGRK